MFGPTGRVVDLGRTTRLFTGAARRALEIAEPECPHPMCDDRSPRREGHHLQPWEHGGPTDQTNGLLPCPHHHQLVDHRKPQPFHVTRDENGTTHWHRPDGSQIT